MDFHYIHPNTVKTAIQTIVARKRGGDSFEYSHTAALSTNNPGRRVVGNWKTPLCQRIEQTVLR